MSGHSKWHSIRRSKAILDNKRGAVFTKIAREITVAVREGGSGDPDTNFRLRVVLQNAKAENMPADKITEAVKRGLGGAEGEAQDEEITYEGYGPGGCALLVRTYTNNRNRTASDVRSSFTKGGGNFARLVRSVGCFSIRGSFGWRLASTTRRRWNWPILSAGADDVQQYVDEETDQQPLEIRRLLRIGRRCRRRWTRLVIKP